MSFPTNPRPTPDEALAVLIEHGYSIVRPGEKPPQDWVKLATLITTAIALIAGMFTAQNVALKPSPATPEQVQEVKEKIATPAQINEAVWNPKG